MIVVGLGEILWDMLPEGKQLGGAPANFAYHAGLLGHQAVVASRVGADDLGRQAQKFLREATLTTEYVQTDEAHPTGEARVETDQFGNPTFEIVEDVAWDYMEWDDNWEQLAERAGVVCFGTLAQRSATSRRSIRRFLEAAGSEALIIFDANIRQEFYSREILESSLSMARIFKVSREELETVAKSLKVLAPSETDFAREILKQYQLELVCITRAEAGSLLVTEDGGDEHPGITVTVQDTVGAGDAFTAALAHHFLMGDPLAAINEAANKQAAWVASKAGAMPKAE